MSRIAFSPSTPAYLLQISTLSQLLDSQSAECSRWMAPLLIRLAISVRNPKYDKLYDCLSKRMTLDPRYFRKISLLYQTYLYKLRAI